MHYPEDGYNMIFRNVENYLPNDMA